MLAMNTHNVKGSVVVETGGNRGRHSDFSNSYCPLMLGHVISEHFIFPSINQKKYIFVWY